MRTETPKLSAELFGFVHKAKVLHERERRITLESVQLIGIMERRNVCHLMGMSSAAFAAHLGLTLNQYWKRAQAARVLLYHPQFAKLIEEGKTEVSCIALLGKKLTAANAAVILEGIARKSKRDVEAFLSTVTNDGRILDKEPEVELHIRLTESELKLLDRAREVLSHSGKVPTLGKIFTQALNDLLQKRDPMEKAERAVARITDTTCIGTLPADSATKAPGALSKSAHPSIELKSPHVLLASKDEQQSAPSPAIVSFGASETSASSPHFSSPGKGFAGRISPQKRPAVPAAVKHHVWLRDEGQCTWVLADGSRCPERLMLELDHQTPWCRGGKHTARNLQLRCRRHNQFAAKLLMGERSPSP